MPGPEEWRSRRAASQERARRTESGLSARFTSFQPAAGGAFATAHRPMNPDARTALAGARAGRWRCCSPASACSGRSRSTPTCPAFTGIAHALGASPVRDAADAVGVPVRLRGDEPVPRRALRQLRPPSGGARADSPSSRSSRSAARSSQHVGTLVFFRARRRACRPGAGIVVSRAVIRDMFPPADAQRVMSQVTIYFGVAPAVAPMVGGLPVRPRRLAVDLLASSPAVGVVLLALNWKLLPETLHDTHKQPFNTRPPAARLLGAWLATRAS